MPQFLQVVMILLIIVLVLTIIGSIFFNVYKIFEAVTNFFLRDYINRNLLFKNLRPKYKSVLTKYSAYYNGLSNSEKSLFERRVQKFINMKKFTPRGDLQEVTVEMKALIASCAIQLTFGYPGIYFSYFQKIIIYNNDYYSTITRKYHQGEVNTRGYIVLSWRNFVKGYTHISDGRNLGLHEMAHALMLENAYYNYEYDFLDFEAVTLFDTRAKEEMQKINNGESSFFRSYAGTNIHEFFAIAVENFFERTQGFYNYDPYLYHLMCRLLLQDPLKNVYSRI